MCLPAQRKWPLKWSTRIKSIIQYYGWFYDQTVWCVHSVQRQSWTLKYPPFTSPFSRRLGNSHQIFQYEMSLKHSLHPNMRPLLSVLRSNAKMSFLLTRRLFMNVKMIKCHRDATFKWLIEYIQIMPYKSIDSLVKTEEK